MKVLAYERCSGLSQVSGGTWDRQDKAIQDYAASHGLEIVHTFRDEGVSGTLQDRPALGELMVSLEENGHGATTVIVEKLDRLARDLLVQEVLIGELKKKGFNLISAQEGGDLLSGDPTRTLVRQLLGIIAQYEKTVICLRMKAGSDRIRAQGLKCGGRKAYDEKMTEVCSRTGQLRAEGYTYSVVADKLNSAGYASLSGKPFTKRIVLDLLRIPTRRKYAKVQGSRTASA